MFTIDTQLTEGVDYDLFETIDDNEIRFKQNFNKRIEYLPNNITTIIFNDKFNNCVDYLPNQTTHIYFGSDFNKPIDNLPNDVKFISFGVNFQQQINCLPNSVEEIRLTQHYNQEIKILPKMLKTFNVCQTTREIINQTNNHFDRRVKKYISTFVDSPIDNYYSKYSELEEKYPNVIFYY